jgi:hypothetical protein
VNMDVLALHVVLFGLDVNGDAVCEHDVEPTGAATYQFDTVRGPLAAPTWMIGVARASTPDAPFVCDSL